MPEISVTTSPSGNIAYCSIPELSLVVLHHAKCSPNDLEWQAYLDFTRRLEIGRSAYGILVDSDGGHPTRSQQQRMSEVANGALVRVAVISPSTTARFVTSVLVLANPKIRCFSPAQRLQAYAHLHLPATATERVNEISAQVRAGAHH
ncbi:MAG TPA: hypothetical protein VIV60_29575 [Polyangiaceae bacterium]